MPSITHSHQVNACSLHGAQCPHQTYPATVSNFFRVTNTAETNRSPMAAVQNSSDEFLKGEAKHLISEANYSAEQIAYLQSQQLVIKEALPSFPTPFLREIYQKEERAIIALMVSHACRFNEKQHNAAVLSALSDRLIQVSAVSRVSGISDQIFHQ